MSSFFDEASLVMIPSGYKDQKVYSVKPLDGSGDLTFSRASSATRVASNGLIEKVRTNLITYSQAFDNAAWTKGGVGTFTSAVTAGFTDPTGGSNAQRWLATIATTSDRAFVRQLATLTNGIPYNVSFWIKSNTASAQELYIQFQGAPVVTIAATTTWTRISFTQVTSSTSVNVGLDAKDLALDVLIYGFQLETGDVATDYIATTTTAVSVGPVSGLPRLDYLNSTCPRLLLEPQRTNIATYSEQFDNIAGWTLFNGTQVTNTTETLDPAGYYGAEKVIMGGTNSATYRKSIGGLTDGDTYTLSLYIKQGSGVTAFLDICDGSTTADITPTSQWVRYTKTGVWNTSLNFIDLEFRGTAGAYCYIWGAQLEAGAYATSYIPTLGTSVTRVADAALTGSVPSLIGQTSGTIFWQGSVDYRQSGDGHALALSGSASSFGDAILLYRQSSNGHLAIYIQIGGANQFATPLTYNDTSSISENDKYAIAYANNDLVVYKNGVQIISASSGSIPACNYFLLNEWNNTYVNTNITKQAILFPTRLSNSDLAALTA